MKLFSLVVLFKGQDSVQVLKAAHDLSSFSFFQRSSIQVSKLDAEKILLVNSYRIKYFRISLYSRQKF